MNRIFINYRREDTPALRAAPPGGARGALRSWRGRRRRGGVRARLDFVDAIARALEQTEVMLVVIGPRWLSSSEGRRRLHQADDFVRIEIAAGLRRSSMRVIPVLVGGATMPAGDELPEDLRSLTRGNAFELVDMRWRAGRDHLALALDRVLDPPGSL